MKVTISYLLFSFLVFESTGDNSVFGNPSWLEAKALSIFFLNIYEATEKLWLFSEPDIYEALSDSDRLYVSNYHTR